MKTTTMVKTTRKRAKGRSLRAPLLMVVAAALGLGLFAGTALAAPPWSDAPNSWWTSSYGVTDTQAGTVAAGYSDGTFKPALAVTRGQFAKMAVDGFGVGTSAPPIATFSDVLPTNYYFPWVEGAYDAAIIGGYGDGTFRPGTSTSRQQANSILGLFLSQKELSLTGHIRGELGIYGSLSAWYAAEGATVLASFVDRASVAPVHAPATAYLAHRHVVQGSARSGGVYLDPGSGLARAQAVALILRVKSTTFVTTGLHLNVSGISNPATAGMASGVTVTVVDEAHTVVTGYTGTIHFTSTDPFPAVLPANYTFTSLDAGMHTFAGGVTLKTAGSQTVTATDTVTGTITGAQTVTVNPAAATKVVIEDAATSAGTPVGAETVVAGDHIDLYANSHDQYDNFVANVAATWSLSNLVPASGGIVAGDLVPASGTKSAVFTGHLVGTGKINAAASGLTTGITGTITVIAGAATKVVFTTSPSSPTVHGTLFAAQPVVKVQDVYGNTVTGATTSITLAFKAGTNTEGATLVGTTTVAASSGVAAFSGLSVRGVGSYQLTATGGTLTPADSTAFSISLRLITLTSDAGQTKVYGAADPTFTYTVTAGSLAAGDTFSGAPDRALGEDVGTYPIGIGTLTVGANYTVAFVAADFTVTPKPITGSFTVPASKVFDGTTDATVLTRGLTGLVGADDVTLDDGTAAYASPEVGTDITVTLTGATLAGTDAGNYTLSGVDTTTADITPT